MINRTKMNSKVVSVLISNKTYFQQVIFLTYTLGVSLMFYRIISGIQFSDIVPMWYDLLVALGGFYGGGILLILLFNSKIVISHQLDKYIFTLIGIHLVAAAFGHLFMILIQDHQILNLISIELVYLLLLIMLSLAFYSFRIKQRNISLNTIN